MTTGNPWAIRRPTRQTRLGISDQGLLTIIQNLLSISTSNDRPGQTFYILGLPDELLVKILEFAALRTQQSSSYYDLEFDQLYSINSIAPLALTCKRFNRLVLPFLYHSIRFVSPKRIAPATRALRILLRTLQSNPSLGQLCQCLRMHIPDIGFESIPEDFAAAEELTRYLVNLRHLYIHGGFSYRNRESTWNIIRSCVKHMGRLEELSLGREDLIGIEIPTLMRELQIPSLRKLQIHGASMADHDSAMKEHQVPPPSFLRKVFQLIHSGFPKRQHYRTDIV